METSSFNRKEPEVELPKDPRSIEECLCILQNTEVRKEKCKAFIASAEFACSLSHAFITDISKPEVKLECFCILQISY